MKKENPADSGSGLEELAHLLLAARDDRELRRQILALIALPLTQRVPILNTALHEMKLRGEAADAQNAFAALATPAGERAAREMLGAG